jgi:acetolactate synthase-1/2/3 large subunit
VSTVAEVVVRTLQAHGVRRLFGLPGGEVAEILGACRQCGLEFVLTRHENAAAIMAGTTGELTGQPGVVLATVGPGATNLVNGVANAFLERAPLLVISAQVPAAVAPVLPHQRLDLEALFRPITKWSHVLTGSNTSMTVARALRLTTAGRPGPVYLGLPSDIARQDEVGAAAECERPPSPTPPTALAVEAAARLIADARRPVAVVGIGLDPRTTAPALIRFIEALRIPVLVTPKAKGLVPEDHPLFAATCTGMAGDRLVVEFLQGCDLLIGLGFDPTEAIRPFYAERPFLSIAAYGIAEPAFTPAMELVGDVAATLDALRPATPCPAWTPEILAAFRRRLTAHLTPAITGAAAPLSPAQLFARLRDLVPPETILTVDTGAHKLLVGQIWTSTLPQTYLVSHGLSTMGHALPAAIAAKLEKPDRPVVALTGDGGLAMVLQELETATRLRLPVLVVVLSDKSLHLIHLHQERKGVPPSGVDFTAIDFAAVAVACGARGLRVASLSAFEAAVRSGLTADRPTVIDVSIDPADYRRML